MKKILIALLFPLYCSAQQPLYYNLATGKYLVGGLSSDTKPVNPPDNCYFLEANTGNCFISSGGSWVPVTIGITQAAFNAKATNVGLNAGTTGQFLKKNSNTDYDWSWATLSGGGDLLAANNLSDLANAATARTNLSLGNVTNESKATMFTNATFTGTFDVANGSIANADLANSAVANLSGTNTGDNATNTQYSGLDAAKANLSGATFTGMITAPAGTTSLTPVTITNGVLATTSVAGGIENDGKTMYSSTTAGDRGVTPSEKFVTSTATFAVPNSAAAFPVFATTEDAFNVVASTSYFFEGLYEITGMGATTRTTGTLFGGTATITSIRYYAIIQTGAANALGTTQSTKSCVTATSNVLNATATTAAEVVMIRGIVRINGAGTFIPQMIHSADPTGTIVVAVNSYFRMYPIGTNTVIKSGNIN